VRGTYRLPIHPPGPPRPIPGDEEDDDETKFVNRPCYEFNSTLRQAWNDRHCRHCLHYLTSRCPHIDEFLDDVEDLSPE
jgi:hypothetical protein